MEEICPKEKCTGCGACINVCPKKCITLAPDAMDALYPCIDQDLCINCSLCEKTCPNNREGIFHTPHTCYAAWSKEEQTRYNSASGGVAAELYKYALRNGIFTVGVCWDRDNGAYYIPVQNEADIKKVSNSKYVYSDSAGIYIVIKNKLEKGIPVLFIGLPCQVSGLYGYLKKDYQDLITVDIICHGVAPTEYLKQHIEQIEQRKKSITKRLSFRTPKYYTYTYTFTFTDKNDREFYKKTVNSDDNYQLGYHHALIYRENCYQCIYAKAERIADLTIGDFSGLGKFAECSYDHHNVSCVLVNSDKGKVIFEVLKNFLFIDERPLEEALRVEKQLQHPSIPHPKRQMFCEYYKRSRNFKKSADAALKKDKLIVKRDRIVIGLKKIVIKLLPMGLINTIRRK